MKSNKSKTGRQLERHFKGVSNHRRIEIILLLGRDGEQTVDQISEILRCNIKTISQHLIKLKQTGLVDKTYTGRSVSNKLSPYGLKFYSFISSF